MVLALIGATIEKISIDGNVLLAGSVLSIKHNLYNHMTKISKDTKNALVKDFT